MWVSEYLSVHDLERWRAITLHCAKHRKRQTSKREREKELNVNSKCMRKIEKKIPLKFIICNMFSHGFSFFCHCDGRYVAVSAPSVIWYCVMTVAIKKEYRVRHATFAAMPQQSFANSSHKRCCFALLKFFHPFIYIFVCVCVCGGKTKQYCALSEYIFILRSCIFH